MIVVSFLVGLTTGLIAGRYLGYARALKVWRDFDGRQ
jgi:hypothetical protein